ncbi:MAG: lipase family protein, partial [Mycobacterium sp.]
MSRLTRWAASAAATAVVLAPALSGGAAHAAASPSEPPSADIFYQYGVSPSASVKPGTVLDHRPVTLSGVTGSAEQLLYRTTDEQGRPSATVTTVINPSGASKGIVAYLSYYDGLGDTCDPSYTLQGGGAGPGNEAFVINLLVMRGYAVTVPDYEGETHDWAAGDESGWSTLDAIRATESHLGVGASTKVALAGYSGGSIAGEWASELAPTYAPELNLVGTAIGGIPVNLGHVLQYANGSAAWAGVIPAAMVSLGRAFDIDFSQYMSQRGLDDTSAIRASCIGEFNTRESGVKLSDLLLPQYADFLHIPVVASIVSHLTMGTAGVPKAPLMMVNGNSDGTGDGVMVAADVAALAQRYCSAGVPVSYQELAGKSHTAAGGAFIGTALTYIDDRFAGKPAPSTCAPRVIGDPAPPLPKVTIRALSRGHHDIVIVTAPRGATVKVFVAGHKKVVARAVAKKGHARLRVADHNGKRVTHYRVLIGGTTYRVAVR